MQEAALVFNASSKLHEEIESAGEKINVYYFQGQHRPLPQFPMPQKTYLESSYSKILCQKPETLPPTKSRYHSLQTYFQTTQ